MFSGLIETVGTIIEAARTQAGIALRVRCPLAAELAAGDSVAVNGVCLTVVDTGVDAFTADVSPETARVTTLGGMAAGMLVNLERPLRADGRVGGHFVLGHVGGAGRIVEIREEAEFRRIGFEHPPALQPLMVRKGSVAVDGVSLTVAALAAGRFDVQIVPYTWDHTRLRAASVGDAVNLECDIIGKYVLNAVGAMQGEDALGARWPRQGDVR
jgi:riboflavin synthase